MILADRTIKAYLQSGQIVIEPACDLKDVRPTGIRLHLGDELLVPVPEQLVDLASDQEVAYTTVKLGSRGYVLQPGMFVLVASRERIRMPRNIVGHIEGRSTVARLGMSIHCTSGVIDGNFDDCRSVVFEIKNAGPFKLLLRPRLAVAMLLFSQLDGDIEQDSQKQYRGQTGVVAPNLRVQKE